MLTNFFFGILLVIDKSLKDWVESIGKGRGEKGIGRVTRSTGVEGLKSPRKRTRIQSRPGPESSQEAWKVGEETFRHGVVKWLKCFEIYVGVGLMVTRMEREVHKGVSG
jgi:hypothetical protein